MMRIFRTTAVLAVASCATSALAGLASTQAFAATTVVKVGGYMVVKKTVSLPAGGFVRQTALCPAGKVVLGGGAQVVGAGSANFATEIQESAPGTIGGSQSLWLAAASNHSATSRTLGIFAVCANRPGGYTVVKKTVSLPAGGFVRQTALCPAGKVVLGGGAQVVGAGSANFATEVQEFAPGTVGGGQSLWLAAVSNHSATSRTLGILAVCANKPSGYKVAEKTVSLQAGGFVRQTALCPAGKVVLGGGAQVVGAGTANFATEVQESAPGTVGGSQSLWLMAASNHSATSRTLGIFAVCAIKK